MTKVEMASYLASLLAIMASRDAAGAIGRGRTIAQEYDRVYSEFIKEINQEARNEGQV